MKNNAVIVLILVGLVFSSFMFSDVKKLAIGDNAPLTDLKMESTIGKKISLQEVVGENGMLVIFSCNTCPFVVGGRDFKGWEKDYNDLHDVAKAHGIGSVLVNSNEAKRKDGDNMKDMKARAKKMGYKMPYVLDKDHQLADAFGAKTTPHVFLFDASMKLIYMGAIDNQWNPTAEEIDHHLIDAMKLHAAGKDITKNTTGPKGCSIKRKS